MKTMTKPAAPYGLHVIESCFGCVLHEEGLFCRLPNPVLSELAAIRQTVYYPQGALLFVQGDSPRGIYILCDGQAKLSASSREGRNVTLRHVSPGEVLGISSVIANTPLPATAETLGPVQVSFVPRPDFLRFLRTHPEVSGRVAEHLSMELHKAWEQTGLLALAPTAEAKLAQLLLNWANEHVKLHDGARHPADGFKFQLNMTHQAIGENIGATRETVSRLMSEFQRRGLIRTRGGSVQLLQPSQLRALSGC